MNGLYSEFEVKLVYLIVGVHDSSGGIFLKNSHMLSMGTPLR